MMDTLATLLVSAWAGYWLARLGCRLLGRDLAAARDRALVEARVARFAPPPQNAIAEAAIEEAERIIKEHANG